MRCPIVHQFNECLALQCEDYEGHQGPCHVTRDGQEFFVSHDDWKRPLDEYGQPKRFSPIGCTNVQANS